MTCNDNKFFDICFVILHFLDADMTMRCVDTLLDTFKNDYVFVVVVDNGSNNESGKLLTNHYSKCDEVYILLSEKNLGFSNGNNLGYRWVIKNISCEFISVINNDVLITQKNCIETIRKCYKETSFAVMGPDIVSQVTKLHQNPLFEKGFSLREMESFYRYMKLRRDFFALYYMKKSVKRFISRFNDSFAEKQKCEYRKLLVNPVLFGACYFLSEKFFANFYRK